MLTQEEALKDHTEAIKPRPDRKIVNDWLNDQTTISGTPRWNGPKSVLKKDQ